MEKIKENLSQIEALPKVFIVALNYNGRNTLAKKLTEIFRSNYGNFEVVLVDNDSSDGSLEEIRGSFSRVILIKNSQNVGRAGGLNIGIKYALERGAQYLLLLRDGVSIPKETLPDLVAEMEKDKTLGLVSPIIYSKAQNEIYFSGGKINWLKMQLETERCARQEKYYNSAYLDGGTMLVRAEVFRKVGILKEDFFYGGEAEFSFRAKMAGYKLLISPDCQAICSEEKQTENEEEAYRSFVSNLLFFRNNMPSYFLPWRVFFLGALRIKNWAEVRFSSQNREKILMRQRALREAYPKRSLF